jgi:hypothetical protein
MPNYRWITPEAGCSEVRAGKTALILSRNLTACANRASKSA